jgi:hypothetical protein
MTEGHSAIAEASPLSISHLRTPAFQKRRPPERRMPVAKAAPLIPPEPVASAVEPIHPKTFSKKSFVARLDCFEPAPRAVFVLSYTNGRILPSLQNLMKPHMGVIYSIVRDGFVFNLFTARDSELTDLSAVFLRVEHFYDLLNGETEISQTPLLRNRAAACANGEGPLELFLKVTPGLSRAEIDDVYLEDRRQFSSADADTDVVFGDCFPFVPRMELSAADGASFEAAVHAGDPRIKIGGFGVLK